LGRFEQADEGYAAFMLDLIAHDARLV
jgi:hypothetical protein